MSEVLAKFWATSTISYLRWFLQVLVCAHLQTAFCLLYYLLTLKVSRRWWHENPKIEFICVDIGFFLNIRQSFTKLLNCVSTISSINLIRSNIKSGTTIESLFIWCSFVDVNGFIGNTLDKIFWCQTLNSYRKCHYPHGVLLKEHFWLIVFLLTSQTLWWFWKCHGHMFPNESMMNHHVCWPNLLPHQIIWLPCCFARALGQEPFSRILYLTFERKENHS